MLLLLCVAWLPHSMAASGWAVSGTKSQGSRKKDRSCIAFLKIPRWFFFF